MQADLLLNGVLVLEIFLDLLLWLSQILESPSQNIGCVRELFGTGLHIRLRHLDHLTAAGKWLPFRLVKSMIEGSAHG
jgi:hypothetical protein